MVYCLLDFGIYCSHSCDVVSKLAEFRNQEARNRNYSEYLFEHTIFERILSINDLGKSTFDVEVQERVCEESNDHIPKENSTSDNPKNPVDLILAYDVVCRCLI